MRLLTTVAILATAIAMQPVDALDRPLLTTGMAGLPGGEAMVYRYRHAAGVPGRAQPEYVIRLQPDPDKAGIVAVLEGDGVAQQLNAYRGSSENPILLVFLDSVVSRVSDACGANPFYLRARVTRAMRERMRERPVSVRHRESELPARELALRPFEGDEHAAAPGAFADLELTLVVSDAVPGGFVSLRATAGDPAGGYVEEIKLDVLS